MFELLRSRCGLRPGAAVFEVGPGTGIATRELLRAGAGPLSLIEPDPRLRRFLERSLRPSERPRVRWYPSDFERALLPSGAFDLGVAAQSFHWVPRRTGLRKVARVLRSGGWWASWGNHHGDPFRDSPFSDAIQIVYRDVFGRTSARRSQRTSERKERAAQLAALRSVGRFRGIGREDIRWDARLSGREVTDLWSTFSEIMTLAQPKRHRFLTGIERIVNEEFGGHVRLPMLTPVYFAERN